MKRFILPILFISFLNAVKAQSYSIINDKDGFVNVRKEPDAKSEIVGKLYIDDIFGVDEEDKAKKFDWLRIYKQRETRNGLEGYIHKSRNFYLSNFKTIKKVKVYADSCICTNDSISVVIKSAVFKPKNHKLYYSPGNKEENTATTLDKIDGKGIWGTDGGIPKTKITLLRITINGHKIDIPKNSFDDLYEPNYSMVTVYLGTNNTIYIEMGNSDGAGAYSVIWIIKNGKYLKRYIDNSNA